MPPWLYDHSCFHLFFLLSNMRLVIFFLFLLIFFFTFFELFGYACNDIIDDILSLGQGNFLFQFFQYFFLLFIFLLQSFQFFPSLCQNFFQFFLFFFIVFLWFFSFFWFFILSFNFFHQLVLLCREGICQFLAFRFDFSSGIVGNDQVVHQFQFDLRFFFDHSRHDVLERLLKDFLLHRCQLKLRFHHSHIVHGLAELRLHSQDVRTFVGFGRRDGFHDFTVHVQSRSHWGGCC
mmetsp:Transcript_18214/g.32067  ORF Transcript_18214/g.32067 Transcript_18214/m.32067 type:complete len:234 (+) Transcript_18214:73-774(+)